MYVSLPNYIYFHFIVFKEYSKTKPLELVYFTVSGNGVQGYIIPYSVCNRSDPWNCSETQLPLKLCWDVIIESNYMHALVSKCVSRF